MTHCDSRRGHARNLFSWCYFNIQSDLSYLCITILIMMFYDEGTNPEETSPLHFKVSKPTNMLCCLKFSKVLSSPFITFRKAVICKSIYFLYFLAHFFFVETLLVCECVHRRRVSPGGAGHCSNMLRKYAQTPFHCRAEHKNVKTRVHVTSMLCRISFYREAFTVQS